MDISCNIQEDDEIRELLEELRIEQEKYDASNKSQKQLEHISVICFTRNIQSVVDKLFSVSVKIYDSLNEIYALNVSNDGDIVESKHCKYYLVKIQSSQLLQSNLINNNWNVNVCVKNDEYSVCKTVHLKRLIPSDTFNVIVPFAKSIKDASIETRLFSPLENFWANLKISSVTTNISHHFIPFNEHRLLQRNQRSILFEISTLYTDVKLKKPEPVFEYTFSCKTDVRHFYEVILKHCIHRLDTNHMQLLAKCTDGAESVNLIVDDTNSTVTLDKDNNVIKIAGNVEVLHRIKEFLILNLNADRQSRVFDEILLTRLSGINVDVLMEGRNGKPINFGAIKQLYQEYKNIISHLPM